MRALLLTILFAFGSLASTAAQTYESTNKGTRTEIMLRVQRVESTSSACALVYPDGKAHYEIAMANGTAVYEGMLAPDSQGQLKLLLPAVAAIDPSSIVQKTRVDDIDMVLVSVSTPNGLHNLRFSDPSTRKPVKQAIDPVLKWLSSMNHQHLPELKKAKATNCLPQDSFDPGSGKSSARLAAAMGHAMAEHMLMRMSVFGADETLLHERCVLVLPGGQYHYENTTVTEDNKRSTKVYAGALGEDEVAHLKEILGSPAIRNAEHTAEPPNGLPARDVESLELVIPRENQVQTLRIFSVSGVNSAFRNVKVDSDLDRRTIDPLRSFVHTSIEKRKGIEPVPNAAPNNCASY
jgi:hypothetical protein